MTNLIGVATSDANLEIAREFFELFKTPWEPAERGRRYRTILCSDDARAGEFESPVLLVYGCGESAPPGGAQPLTHVQGPVEIRWGQDAFPIYGRIGVFESPAVTLVSEAGAIDRRDQVANGTVWRVGYDLFAEIRHLLTVGQPVRYAHTPTLEFHVALLKHLLQQSAVPFVEIPPRPAGYQFACCLTHDVDFFGIRRHRFDRTLAGFISRAAIGTTVDFLHGRRPAADVFRNWKALCSLPLVQMNLLRDFWTPIDDYLAADGDRPATFFVIPFKGHAGVGPDDRVNRTRAVSYEAADVSDDLSRASARGKEIALHGIDAWRDVDRGIAESAQVSAWTGSRPPGVRMHWLYFSQASPRTLEEAGFDYDSTCGYNETVGFRAGTSQAFRLPGTRSLMELPLLIMDSALFFRDRMHLTIDGAARLCSRIVAQARRFGGTLVINWHDRSLAPERLWEKSYQHLLAEVASGGRVWFATASQAVAWYRWRRSIAFDVDAADGHIIVTSTTASNGFPGACVRVHQYATDGAPLVRDIDFAGDQVLSVLA